MRLLKPSMFLAPHWPKTLGEQMRDAVVDVQLDDLRVDHDEPDVLGALRIQDRGDKAVDAHALSASGGTGDQQVGTLGDIEQLGIPLDVASENHRDAEIALLQRIEKLLEADRHALGVRHLDAHGALARHGGEDADHLAADPHGDVLLEVHDLGDQDTRGERVLVKCDGRSLDDVGEFHLDPEVMHHGSDQLACAHLGIAHLIAGLGEILQQIRRRRVVAASLSPDDGLLALVVALQAAYADLELDLAAVLLHLFGLRLGTLVVRRLDDAPHTGCGGPDGSRLRCGRFRRPLVLIVEDVLLFADEGLRSLRLRLLRMMLRPGHLDRGLADRHGCRLDRFRHRL